MKLFEGTGFLVAKTRAKIVTAYLRGAARLPYSRNPNRKQWFPRISVHFSPIQTPPQLDHLSAAAARLRLTNWLRDRLIRQQFEVENGVWPGNVPDALRDAARRHAGEGILQVATIKSSLSPLDCAATVLGG
jgi:acyl-[acyl-carrier-protein]-phospholipid O-acyltransferase/long-chain-fatty-acid--[acyl-carrier-protein] ligase